MNDIEVSRDADRIATFWNGQAAVPGPEAARFHSEHDRFDLAAISRFCVPGSEVLDLGCGTCVIANALVQQYHYTVHAVDYIPAFLAHAAHHPSLTTEAADIRHYCRVHQYDAVLLLGVITSLEGVDEREEVYRNCAAMLKPEGVLFVKAQFGIEDEVIVDGWSEQLGAHYRAVYPQLQAEVDLLQRFFDVEVEDPYPSTLNPHQNTHFHYLLARKR